MIKKLFVVSDIHGHYTEMMSALKSVGFDKNSEDHIFVSCGDLFDRGKENLQVYDFIKGLKNKILIKGNHEDYLREILELGYITERDTSNETDITIKQIIGEDVICENGALDISENSNKINEIIAFIDSMMDYYETEKHVFTHGWVPIEFEGRYPHINPNWRDASVSDWNFAREVGWYEVYGVGAVLKEKNIVCGHRPSRFGYKFDDLREHDCSEPFFGNGVIAIDAHTIRSGRVNVLVIEE